jgi:hypothetical protein
VLRGFRPRAPPPHGRATAPTAHALLTTLTLGHGFHEVDFLPENDRVRFTISPAARREVLKRLLKLNHKYHAEEDEVSTPGKRKKKSGKVPDQLGLGY